MTFAVRASSDRARLIVTSDVPRRLARGHRELLIVYAGNDMAAQKLLDGTSDSLAVDLLPAADGVPGTAWSFLKLGNQHILSGYDHLLFLAGLFLAAGTARQLIALLTAFTIAHSISLALVVLAGVHLPASIVEPLIAASIAWVGGENLFGARHRRRWRVDFGFGMIHGFGFAGALTDLGFGSAPDGCRKGAVLLQRWRRVGSASGRGRDSSSVVDHSINTGVANEASTGVLSARSRWRADTGCSCGSCRSVHAGRAATVPTKYFSPVGARTPPAGSMVTASATGCGISDGVLNVSFTPPCASGVSSPALRSALVAR